MEKRPYEDEIHEMLRYLKCMEFDRLEAWQNHHADLDEIDPYLNTVVRSLGFLDATLCFFDKKLSKDKRLAELPAINGTMLQHHFSQCSLWIFGVYELLRTVAEFATANPTSKFHTLENEITHVKNYFAMVRMPMAKLQPKGKRNIKAVVQLIIIDGAGAGWRYGPNPEDWIARNALAEKLLNLFRVIHK